VSAKQVLFGESAHTKLLRGMNTLADAVRVGVFLRDMQNFPTLNEIYREFFAEPLPARTTIQSDLPGFEIDLTKEECLLALQLTLALQAICVQSSFRNRCLHGAIGLGVVGAVAESTGAGERFTNSFPFRPVRNTALPESCPRATVPSTSGRADCPSGKNRLSSIVSWRG